MSGKKYEINQPVPISLCQSASASQPVPVSLGWWSWSCRCPGVLHGTSSSWDCILLSQ